MHELAEVAIWFVDLKMGVFGHAFLLASKVLKFSLPICWRWE